MAATTAAPGQQIWSRSVLILVAVALVLPYGSFAQGLQGNRSMAPVPAPVPAVAIAVPPTQPPPVSTARPPPPPPASPTAVAPSTTATTVAAEAPAPSTSPRPSPPPPASPSPSPVAASPPPASPPTAAAAAPASNNTARPPPPPATATVAASPPTAAASPPASFVAAATGTASASPPSPAVTAAPPTVASPPPPSFPPPPPPTAASPPTAAVSTTSAATTPTAPTQAPAAALQSPPPSPPPPAAAASPPTQSTASSPAVAVRELAGAAPQTAVNGSSGITAFNYTAPAPAPRLAVAPSAATAANATAPAPTPAASTTPTAAAKTPAAAPAAGTAAAGAAPVGTPTAAAVGAPRPAAATAAPAAAPTALLVTVNTPGPVGEAPVADGPTAAAANAAIESAVGPAAFTAPVGAPTAAANAVTSTVVRTAAAPAVTGNYSTAGAPTPSGAILAAPAPGSNDAARLAGQPTTTLDAEVLVSGNDLIPFNAQKEQAVANSIKAILANYTTVVSVNGATPRGTATTPVAGPGLPPGTTETVTFVPSSAPTPPVGSVSVSVSPTSGRKLLATAQQSVQVNITVTTNTANATAVQDAINQAINNGQLAATLQAAGLDASDVSAVSINVIAVNTPPSPPPPAGSTVNTAPAIAPAPKSSTPTGAIVGAVVGGVVGAALLITGLYCCIAVRTRKRNRDLEAIQARLSSKESYDSGSSDEAHRLPAFFPGGGKSASGLAKIRTGKLGGKADPLRASSEALSSSEFSSTDYTDSNEKVLHGSGHVPPTVASSDVTSPGATSVQPGESTELGSEDTALAALVGAGSETSEGTLLVAGRNRQNVNANLWQILWKDLNVQKQIGEGSFGKVYLAKWRETTVAAKVLLGGTTNSTDEEFPNRDSPLLDGLTKEAGMMASLRHPNVVMYLGVCMDPPCVITEYCARGSLNDVLKRARYVPALAMQLDWPRRLNMCLDAAKGMMYLHSSDPPIIHRDLKSPNLLVDKHWRVKVCDFNLSRVMEETVVLSSMAASNPRWLAPEILSGRGYTYSSDVYSFGIIMWEFLTWRVPWHECGPWQVVALVTEGSARPEIPPIEAQPSKTFPGYEDYVKLMQRCWAQDPEARPDFTQIISALRKLLASEMQTRQKEEKATIMS